MKTSVIFGLGSNVGDREAQLNRACEALSGVAENLRRSRLYASPALLPEGAPAEWNTPFLNMAASGDVALPPEALLAEVKRIETELGRTPRGHWGPREIDIDILAYGETVMLTPALTLPHKELAARDFALLPMCDIAPKWQHPLLRKTALELASTLAPTARVWEGVCTPN